VYRYKQTTGELFDASGSLMAPGYAGGNCGKNPEGKNNQVMQNVAKIGPLPQGVYTFGQPILQSHLGPFAVPLLPDASNLMFGRTTSSVTETRPQAVMPARAALSCQETLEISCGRQVTHAVEVVQ